MAAVLALPPHVVTVTQRFVLLSYANHANRDGAMSFPGRSTVAAETGCSERTVSRATAQLRAMGLLRVSEWPGRGDDGRFTG